MRTPGWPDGISTWRRPALGADFRRSVAARGRTGSIDVLLERHAEESRDDASAGDERAAQRT
jgi:hypothetical protein